MKNNEISSEISNKISNNKSLKNKGLKITYPRLKILEIFDKSDVKHLTPEDVRKKLAENEMELGLATIYRVLTQFEKIGILIRHNFDFGKNKIAKSVFELNKGSHHDHLVCINCGKVEEFYDEVIEKKQIEITDKYGFHLKYHNMCLYAICSECAAKKQNTKTSK